uniref:AT-rich interactive domain 5A n=1 Tax=Takifugu rubripes TaxID=31033 RepID=A0A3B5KNI0_TAKRU
MIGFYNIYKKCKAVSYKKLMCLAPQASAVIEIRDSMTECEDEARPSGVHMEEKTFVSSLHTFMKERGSPIERIPHLGFKQINLWMIYKTVEKLGGYDSVTARRLWKKVYDELGGSPGSTSAATCTRKHYEKLVLPFERHMKGEDDRPLPTSKPRKPYKRNLDAVCHSSAAMQPLPALWAAAPDPRQPNRAVGNRCTSVYARLVQVPTSSPWNAHVPSAAGEVISPLEKKKRMAQASLSSPQGEEKERPSVIQCSQSPAQAYSSHNCNSSDGSPVPLSPFSSRSPSPYSVSSDDGAAENGDKPACGSQLPDNPSDSGENKSGWSEERKTSGCAEVSRKEKDNSQPADSIKDSMWRPIHKISNKYFPHASRPHPTFNIKSDWAPASTSSFTKVIPKSVQPLRPAPIRPPVKGHQVRLLQQDDYPPCAKKPTSPWPFQMEKRDKPRTVPQKAPAAQHGLSHPTASRQQSCVLSNYDKAGRDSQQQSLLHPTFLSNRMRLPPSQLLYHQVPVGLAQSALIGSAVYQYPYTLPQLTPQTGYFSPAMTPIYPHNF